MAKNLIKAYFVGDTSSLDRASKQAVKDVDETGKGAKKASGVAKLAFAGIAGAALEAAKSSLEAADKQDGAHVQLQQAFRATGQAGGKWVDEAVAQGQRFGDSQADIEAALAVGVRALGSSEKAHRALNIAENISAATGKPLADSMLLATKAAEGQTKALKALAIDSPVAAGGALKVKAANEALAAAQKKALIVAQQIHSGYLKGPAAIKAFTASQDALHAAQAKVATVTKAGGDVLSLLEKKYKGSASDASHTFEGKTKALHAELTNLEAEAGEKLQPVLVSLGSTALNVAGYFEKHKGVAKALAATVGVLTAAFIAFKIQQAFVTEGTFANTAAQAIAKTATAAWTAAQWLLNVALDANPIGLIVIAIAAFIAGIVLAYQHVDGFRALVQAAFRFIKSAIETAFNWVKDHWPLLLAILTGPIGIAVLLITKHWDAIKNGISAAFNWIKDHWPLLLAILTGPIGIAVLLIVRHWNDITNGFRAVVTAISNGVSDIVGFITSLPGRVLGAAVGFGKAIGGGIISGLGQAAGAVGDFIGGIASGFRNLVNSDIIDPIRNVHISWGGFHGIGAFDIHPFSFLPRLHSGGIFQAGGMAEGLAMLRSGEGVFTPEQMRALAPVASMPGGTTIINLPAGVDPDKVVRAQRRFDRINGVTT